MAFWGQSFIFNGIPSDDFDLMIYDFGSATQSPGTFASGVTVVDSLVPSRWKPYFYGTTLEEKLSFTLVFGVKPDRLEVGKYLNRSEMEAIASWLCGHKEYLWLQIEQPDMKHYRYHCVVTAMEMVEYGNIPWALSATFTCDSPYAYLYPQEFVYEIPAGEEKQIEFYNQASYNGYFCPVVDFEFESAPTYISIKNGSDNNREFRIGDETKQIPSGVQSVHIDNDHGIIESDNEANLYDMFNFKYLRLLRGENRLTVQTDASATMKILCEFPVDIGG